MPTQLRLLIPATLLAAAALLAILLVSGTAEAGKPEPTVTDATVSGATCDMVSVEVSWADVKGPGFAIVSLGIQDVTVTFDSNAGGGSAVVFNAGITSGEVMVQVEIHKKSGRLVTTQSVATSATC